MVVKNKFRTLPIEQKPIDPGKASIRAQLRKYGINYHAGFFHLRGNNPITRAGLWPRIQKYCAEEGECVLVKFAAKREGDEDNFLAVAKIQELEEDLLEIKKLVVVFEDAKGNEVLTKDLLVKGGSGGDSKSSKASVESFIIFRNTPFAEPDLAGSELQLKFLDMIYRSMIYDLEIFRPRLILKTTHYPNEHQKKIIHKDLDKWDVITYASLGDGKKMDFEKWLPESRHDKLKDLWSLNYNLWKELNGIRYNPTKRVEGRLAVKEVELEEQRFEGTEMLKQQEREFNLRTSYRILGGESYQLIVDGKIVFQIGDIHEVDVETVEDKKPEEGKEEDTKEQKEGEAKLEKTKIEKPRKENIELKKDKGGSA